MSTEDKNTNISIWNKVNETDEKFTSLVEYGAFAYTAICSTYQAERATELFGPYGDGWGLINIEYDWSLKDENLAIIHADFFYNVDGEYQEFEISNAIAFKSPEKYKPGEFKVDPDFAKKIETNTVSKALSKLGFSADVYAGKFEDNDYLNEQRLKSGLEAIEAPTGDIKDTATKDFYKWCVDQTENYKTLKNEPALKAVYNDNMKKAREKCKLLSLDFNDIGAKFQRAQRDQMAEIQKPIDNLNKSKTKKGEKNDD